MNRDHQTSKGVSRPGRFWARMRRAFRWLRIAALTVILCVLGLILWCNYAGVPRSLVNLLVQELRRKNLNLEFSRVHLRGLTRLVARDLRFASAASNNLPRFEAGSAELLLDFEQLRRGELDLSGLLVNKGTVLIPIHETNEAPRFLAISNIVADLDVSGRNHLRVSRLSGETLGAKAAAAGMIRNFARLPRGGDRDGGQGWEVWRRDLREVHDLFETFRFSEKPSISVQIAADATNLLSMRGSISLRSNAAESEWASFDRLELTSEVFSSPAEPAVTGNFRLQLAGFRSRWAFVQNLAVNADSVWTADMEQLLTNRIAVSASNIGTPWGNAETAGADLASVPGATNIQTAIAARISAFVSDQYAFGATELAGELSHHLPFPSPAASFRRLLHNAPLDSFDPSLTGNWRVDSTGLKLARARLQAIKLEGQITATNRPEVDGGKQGFWSYLRSAQIPWTLQVNDVLSDQLSIGTLAGAGEWAWPDLRFNRFEASLYGGTAAGKAWLELTNRRASATLNGEFDYKRVAQLLDRPVQRWLDQFTWQIPPRIHAEATLDLPAWTNSWAEFERQVLPTVRLTGNVHGVGTFRGIPIDNAHGSFFFSNFVWRLPDLVVVRPEGTTTLDYTGNVTNGEFSCRMQARINPTAFRSFVDEKERAAFDLVHFPEAPLLIGEARGDWDRQEEITFRGSVAATNFFVRGKPILDISANVLYSNMVLEAWNVSAHMGTGAVSAPYVRLDWPAEVMFVTNGVSTVDPYEAMFIVGEDAYEAIDPYRFAVPPSLTINGNVPLRHVSKSDLYFEVNGRQFNFWKFRIPNLSGRVHWKGHELWITNVDASFYGGQARWEGYFKIHDFPGDHLDNADFSFKASTRDSDLELLVFDLFGMTNHMEGTLSGDLVITSANSENPKSWNGYGQASLSNGYLWSVPVFGVFTPILDALLPGASMSRVTSGQGTFVISNSVVHAREFQVRAKAFRLNYKGSVDLDGKLDALVEAEILRDAWVVGRAFSLLLWPVSKAFEARVSGTVEEPKTQLRYFPQFLLAPFRVLAAPKPKGQNEPAPTKP